MDRDDETGLVRSLGENRGLSPIGAVNDDEKDVVVEQTVEAAGNPALFIIVKKHETSLMFFLRPYLLLMLLIFEGGFLQCSLAGTSSEYLRLLEIDDTSIPTPLLRLIEQANPLPAERGLIAKLEKSSDAMDATIVLCATTLQQNGEQYANIVRLIHKELITAYDIESGDVRSLHPYFLQSLNRAALFFRCLEHGASNASAEIHFLLFQIEYSLDGGRLSNTYAWLVKSAEAGHIPAQYVLATTVWRMATKPTTAPVVIGNYINPESYHKFLYSAAESGNRLAQLRLSNFYLGLTPDVSWKNNKYVNVEEGLRLLKLVASQSDDMHKRYKAIAMIAALYHDGTEVGDEYPEFISWFQHRAKDRLPNAGGVPKDYSEALWWYLQIPETQLHNNCSAAIGLSKIYRLGQGVEIDVERANKYQRIVSSSCIKK